MTIQTVTDAIRYVGVDDNTLALFENQYPVQPMGVSYNSYVILDEKIAVMDSVDARAAEEWLSNVARVLEGRSPDYLVVTHMEPDHSGSLMRLAQKYPEMKIVGNAKTFTMIKQFFGTGALSEDRMLEVGERDTLSLGLHRLRFLLAPMVHWPEVMAAYEEEEKILFSADAFGRFGSLERTARAPWAPQARRYYYNIVGKYGAQVQALLKKISALEIKTICPLHGPMLTEDLGEYLRLYDLWSQWKPEKPEGILIAHASIHGNTAYASEALKSKLKGKGAQVTMCDLTATNLSYAVTNAFYCGKLVFRQSKDSLIAYNAKFINEGNTKLFYGPDFVFVSGDSQEDTAEKITERYCLEIQESGIENVQILSPFRSEGAASSEQLNETIRELVNPFRSAEEEIKFGPRIFRVNDRIMQTKNTEKVSNGDLGFIRYIKDTDQGKKIGMDFGAGRTLEYGVDDLSNVDLAYATTIHKAMGSEYETVIMPLLKAHTIMMYRNLLYTGITRAKKRVVLIGQKQVLFMAIHRNEIGKRNTLLGMRIQMYFKAYAKKAGIPIPAALEEQLKNAS